MSLLSFYSVHMMRPNAYIVCIYIYIYKAHTHIYICNVVPYSMNLAYFCLVISIYKFGAKFEIISTYMTRKHQGLLHNRTSIINGTYLYHHDVIVEVKTKF